MNRYENKLARSNPYMFRVVHCKAYMKKINDGRHIEVIPGNLTEDGEPKYFYSENGMGIESCTREVPPEDWGGGGFTKTYYERTERDFYGVVIGLKMITVKAELFCDVNYGYDGSEREFIGKNTIEQIKVAVVAYGCNRTRKVRLEDLDFYEKEGVGEA